MKATGIVRRFDDLGRINIPKECRRMIFKTESAEGKPMEIFIDGDSIVLRKYEDEESRKKQEIREKAIDEFINKLLNWKSKDEEYKSLSDVCYEIAEEMKGVRNDY